MRWKERFFLSAGEDIELTIAGFYYIQLCRQTGAVEGMLPPLLPSILQSLHTPKQACLHVLHLQSFEAFQCSAVTHLAECCSKQEGEDARLMLKVLAAQWTAPPLLTFSVETATAVILHIAAVAMYINGLY